MRYHYSRLRLSSSHHLIYLASWHLTCWYWTVSYCIAGRGHRSRDRDAPLQRRCSLAAIWCRSSKVHFISVQDLNNLSIAPPTAIATAPHDTPLQWLSLSEISHLRSHTRGAIHLALNRIPLTNIAIQQSSQEPLPDRRRNSNSNSNSNTARRTGLCVLHYFTTHNHRNNRTKMCPTLIAPGNHHYKVFFLVS